MGGHFEVNRYDAAGRLGELSIPRADATVETPALLPVVNPHVQGVPPADLYAEFGAEMLITNAYVVHGSDELHEPALQGGLHDLLDYPGAIMTDSGAFQLAEYGEIDVTTPEILAFQRSIGSDVATPVDVPTPPDASRERAERDLAMTREALADAAAFDAGEMLVAAPVQGSTYPDLREAAAAHAVDTSLDLFPIGAVVPLLRNYRFADVVEVVHAAKRGLGEAAPVHLFGAGHPMMFALAVAAGCDLFDSAAYALYARDDRYLTVRGTEHLGDLSHFPCHCPVCARHTPGELSAMDEQPRADLLARHNLHVSVGEIRRIRAAIRAGNLLELVESRARAHPAMLSGYRRLLADADRLEATDPVSKGTFFYLSPESARRPEVLRHHERLARFDPDGPTLLSEGVDREGFAECWPVRPPFGPLPPELTAVYPLTAERPDVLDDAAYAAAARGVRRLAEATEASLTLAHRGWPLGALSIVPDAVEVVDRTDSD